MKTLTFAGFIIGFLGTLVVLAAFYVIVVLFSFLPVILFSLTFE